MNRPLTDEETRLLAGLNATFVELISNNGTLTQSALHRHGLHASPEYSSGKYEWTPAFPGWWTPATRPRDPWELWQYIALHWQQHGRTIPEAFASQTNTAQIAERIEPLIEYQEIQQWKHRFPGDAANISSISEFREESLASTYQDLRLIVHPTGNAELQGVSPKSPTKWRAPSRSWIQQMTEAPLSAFEAYPPPARALALRPAMDTTYGTFSHTGEITEDILTNVLSHPQASLTCVHLDGSPFVIEEKPLELHGCPMPDDPKRLHLRLITPEGKELPTPTPVFFAPGPLYLHDHRVWRGPPPLPSNRLPISSLANSGLASHFSAIQLRLPPEIEAKFVKVTPAPAPPLLDE
ncbi:MAG: hypothetical protein J6386_02380 [Candidatus Synoicihabitans palmerolidicus]|nr:hypothetical protein [Candidatus Synoicihabitans palmerolidicus]